MLTGQQEPISSMRSYSISCSKIGVLHLWIVLQLYRRTLQGHAARFHYVRPIGNIQCEPCVLFDQQDCGALAFELLNGFENETHQYGRKSQGRLIEQKQLRAIHHCAANRQHLLFTTGESPGSVARSDL